MSLFKIALVSAGTIALVLTTAALAVTGANEMAKEKFGAPLFDAFES